MLVTKKDKNISEHLKNFDPLDDPIYALKINERQKKVANKIIKS